MIKLAFRSVGLRVVTALLLVLAGRFALAGEWLRADAEHLLRRAGFGGTPAQIDALYGYGRDAAVEYLITGEVPVGKTPVFAPVTFEEFKVTPVEADGNKDRKEQQQALIRQGRQDLQRYRAYWVDRMLKTDRPLEEKMTLFWHGLLCSGIQEVKVGSFMIRQNELFHEQALGNYKKLVASIVHDPAMLRYLDADKNVVGKPNENLAREIMELFTMGEGQGYTEKDIAEVARALTGQGVLQRGPGAGGMVGAPAAYRPMFHDNGVKTIFGTIGNYKPDDVVELIFSRPQPPQYLAKKLWEFFGYPNPSPGDTEQVAAALRESKFELKPALRAMFTSAAFYSEQAKFGLIKSPVELGVGTARMLEQPVEANAMAMHIGKMGQELFQPPNVKGWPGGEQWITAATLYNRYNACSAMVEGTLRPEGGMGMRPNAAKQPPPGRGRFGGMFGGGGGTPVSVAKLFPQLTGEVKGEQVVDAAIARFLQRPLNPEKKAALLEELGEKPIKLGVPETDRRVREMLALLLSTPEYQVH
jgi:uncharacterized protein (DUF1800 family)